MKILQNVAIKQVLTENSKRDLEDKYKREKQSLQKECEQLLFELKKMERQRKYSPGSLKSQFDKEIQQRKDKISIIDFQLEQLKLLPIGSELHDHNVQALVEINIGDCWDTNISGKAIVVRDGVIIDIR